MMSEEINAPPQDRHRPVEFVAVINSFNRAKLLEEALGSLSRALREAPFGSAIVAFEAGSTDSSTEFLHHWRDQNPGDNLIIVTDSDGKSSFSDGVNIGSATAFARFPDCKWLLLYETDNWLANVDPLLDAVSLLIAQPNLAAAGFTVKLHNGQPFGYGMRFPNYTSFVLGQNLSARWDLLRPNESTWQTTGRIRWRTCDVMFTSPLVIRRTAWEQTRGFDSDAFPFSDSDVDWAWRCAELGWKMAVIATDGVVHDNRQQASAWSANRVIDFHRGRLRALKRHRGNRSALIKPLLELRHLLEIFILARKSNSDTAAEAKLDKRRKMLRSVWSDYS